MSYRIRAARSVQIPGGLRAEIRPLLRFVLGDVTLAASHVEGPCPPPAATLSDHVPEESPQFARLVRPEELNSRCCPLVRCSTCRTGRLQPSPYLFR